MRIRHRPFDLIAAIALISYGFWASVWATPAPTGCSEELSGALGAIDRMGSGIGRMGGLMDFRDARLFNYLEEKMAAGERTLGTESGAALRKLEAVVQ